jgi:adenosylcobinamide-GDP ribazoletransferase
LYLDGFTDLLDGLAGGRRRTASPRPVQEQKGSAIGVVALVMLMLLKYLSLFHLPLAIKSAGLIFMPAAGRWVQVVLAVSCRRLRSRDNNGADFLDYAGERELLIACGSLIAVALILFGMEGIFLIFLMGIATVLLIKYFEIRLGGVNNDILGASSELLEVVTLLLVLAVV